MCDEPEPTGAELEQAAATERLEIDKQLIALSSAAFGFSATLGLFMEEATVILKLSWVLLLATIFFVLVSKQAAIFAHRLAAQNKMERATAVDRWTFGLNSLAATAFFSGLILVAVAVGEHVGRT